MSVGKFGKRRGSPMRPKAPRDTSLRSNSINIPLPGPAPSPSAPPGPFRPSAKLDPSRVRDTRHLKPDVPPPPPGWKPPPPGGWPRPRGEFDPNPVNYNSALKRASRRRSRARLN